MRSIVTVLNSLIEICKDDNMINQFNSISESSWFTAPEMMNIRWEQLSYCLREKYEEYKKELWFQEILSIVSTKPLSVIQYEISL